MSKRKVIHKSAEKQNCRFCGRSIDIHRVIIARKRNSGSKKIDMDVLESPYTTCKRCLKERKKE